MPKDNQNLPEKVDINKFLDIEMSRTEIERLREENVAKELEASRESSKEATQIANRELDVQSQFIEKSFDFKKLIVKLGAVLIAILLLGGGALIWYLSDHNDAIIDKIFNFFKDILKILVGFVLGYAAQIVRTNNKRDND